MGRRLDSYTKNSIPTSYLYNESGIRTKKTVNNINTDYYLDGSKIIAQKTGNSRTDFRYDGNGKLIALRYNDTEYYYLTNILGDVTGLIDSAGNSVVQYSYDAWGKLLATTGTLATTLGLDNPFRYRGYYFDNETGFYYLQSRYYDPNTGRFINADDTGVLQVAQGELLGGNLYAYCGNNAVNNHDRNGHFGTPLSWAMATIGAMAGWYYGDYVARKFGYSSGWKYWAIRSGVMVGGAVIGWFAGEALVFVAKSFLLANSAILAKMPSAVLWLLGIKVISTPNIPLPILGDKLQYVFGLAQGTVHNIQRSIQMLNQLRHIGIWDTPYWRNYLSQLIIRMYNNPACAYIQENGRIAREAMLYGPGGALKIRTIWEGARLITIELFGG